MGLGIPLISSSNNARIKAAAVSKKIAATRQDDGRQMLEVQYRNALAVYAKRIKSVAYYQESGINNANQIIKTADSQFSQGEISYLEYTLLLNQALDINSRYYDELKLLNESIFEINYLIKN